MPPKPLPSSILAAIGLVNTTACHPCLKVSACLSPEETGVGPCLDYTVETDEPDDTGDSSDTGDTGDSGDTADSGDTGVNVCLDYAANARPTPPDAQECPVAPLDAACADPVSAVLAREVLPADVAARLRARRTGQD